ncbi:MAG: DUF2726 domain-containing protein [Lachnospiraceae bacterium]|nr:DUF2726 domain-containing protein [Lachnospiraceae bacterium]
MDILKAILFCIILFLILRKLGEIFPSYLIQKKLNEILPSRKASSKNQNIQTTSSLNGKYRKKYLLSKTEYAFYIPLKKKCDEYNLLICPKVRLEDFIQVTAQERMKYRGYIKSRHVDFLICDMALNIITAVELDDESHNTATAQKTDMFKNDLYETIGIPLYRIRTNENYAMRINDIIREQIRDKN